MDPSPKTKGLRPYPRQWNLDLVGAARLPGSKSQASNHVNKKKTKAIWIGSQKKNKNRPLAIDITNEPTKTLGIYISYNRNKNNDQNFFIKIQKMQTKLNVWLSRDLTLTGRTVLVKALGISKIVHSASMLCVPEEVIKRVQEKLFSDLWRNKKDRIERTVLYQTPCRGDLNFPNVRTTVKRHFD